jgi:hypothetical protein
VKETDQLAQFSYIRPPDTHGAVGRGAYAEIVNSRYAVYRITNQTQVLGIQLSSFFGYTDQVIFDPRVVYDKTWNRWVITAEARPESATVQRQFVAISKGSNPVGDYWLYSNDINVFDDPDEFWDFPQVGLSQDAVIITANVFETFFKAARMFAVAKARLYNGLGFSVPMWDNLQISVAPPKVLDQNANTYLLQAPQGGNFVRKYTLTNAAYPDTQALSVVTISVPSYSIPPDARQPGVTNRLDTLDARFGNWSTQINDSIFNTHCVAMNSASVGVVPGNVWYEFDTEGANANTIKQQGTFFAGPDSEDWMPHIAANSERDVFAVWSSTDTTGGGTLPQMRIGGKEVTDATTFLGPGSAVVTSPTVYVPTGSSVERWGDYQCVDVTSGNPDVGFAVAEKTTSTTRWGSHISRIRFR